MTNFMPFFFFLEYSQVTTGFVSMVNTDSLKKKKKKKKAGIFPSSRTLQKDIFHLRSFEDIWSAAITEK